MKAVSWELAAKIEYRELAVKAFLLLVSNSESESLKAEQGGNLQFAEYHGNLQKNALTTYKKKKSGIEKVRNKFQNSPRGF